MKKTAFALATALIPLALLLLAEFGLRWTGAVEDRRQVFVPIPGFETHLALNPEFVARYFSDFVPGVPYTPFAAQKPEDGYRIVVLGGSTVAGFPYRFYNGFPERLAELLAGDRFGRKVEVVNLGMSAVNSYTIRDLARAVAEVDPDAVLIYAGHNEFYGAMGTGASEGNALSAPMLKRLVLRLRHSALYTALEGLIVGPPEPSPADGRTLMARAVRDATIEQDGAVYAAGVQQFSDNLRATIETFSSQRIPVYLGTLTSNLADQPPFSDQADALSAYERGRERLAAGDSTAARLAFVEARAFDTIRFRAPDTLNTIIRAFGRQDGVRVVDIAERFRSASPGGLESDTLFTDHLHPTLAGYGLMAQAFREALLEDREGPALVAPVALTLDAVEQAHVDLLLARLKGDYPYNKVDDEETIANRYRERLSAAQNAGRADSLAVQIIAGRVAFPQAMLAEVQAAQSQNDSLAAARAYRGLLHWQPFNEGLHSNAVRYGLDQEYLDEETDRIASLAARRFDQPYFRTAWATVRIRRGHPGDAATILESVLADEPDEPTALFNLARAQVMMGDTLQARQTFERYRTASQP